MARRVSGLFCTKSLSRQIQLGKSIISRSAHYDVVIGGGGAMGSSAAFFLKSRDPTLKVAVVERDPTYTIASSALSFACIRQQFSIAENIHMSRWSWHFIENIDQHLRLPGSDDFPDAQLQTRPYLFLASTKDGYRTLLKNYKLQRENGVNTQILSKAELESRYPWLDSSDIIAGSTCTEYEGQFDAWSLLVAFKKKAISMGVDYINANVESLDISSKVNGVEITKDNEVNYLSCNNFVNATGPWAGEFMEKHDIYLPVYPRKRYVYVFDCPKGPGRDMPLTICPSGWHCRPEGQGSLYIVGSRPASEEEEPATDNLDVDYDIFMNEIWPNLAERVPSFEELKICPSWAGFYEYNDLDQNGIIGPHNEIENLFFVNGFSGHGIQQSPAVGNTISELILEGEYRTMDLSRFSYDRIVQEEPLREKNVV